MYKRKLNYREIYRRRKVACGLFWLILAEEEAERPRPRNMWVQPYLLRRDKKGMHRNLFLELALEDPNRFRR